MVTRFEGELRQRKITAQHSEPQRCPYSRFQQQRASFLARYKGGRRESSDRFHLSLCADENGASHV